MSLSKEEIQDLAPYEELYIRWRDHRVFGGFGHVGMMAISRAYTTLTGGRPNLACTSCATKATDLVYNQYFKQKEIETPN